MKDRMTNKAFHQLKGGLLLLVLLCIVWLINGCSRDVSFMETQRIGAEGIVRMEVSPNSRVLNADGKSELRFLVPCYYQVDTVEVQLLDERVPLNEITITSSDGKTFRANETYTTTAHNDSISFTATLNRVRAPQVKVALQQPVSLSLTPLRVPIVFVSLYTEQTKTQMENISLELLQQMVEQANKAFSGTLMPAPNGCDAAMQFYVKDYQTVKITDEEAETPEKYIQDKLLSGCDKVLYVWLMNTVRWRLREDRIHPQYTFGNPNDIPGIDFEKVNALSDITNLEPNEVGIAMTFADIYQQKTGYESRPFTRMLGRFYGLLETGINPTKYNKEKDVDYCPDTLPYFTSNGTVEKQSIPLDQSGLQYTFNSYNIMDRNSTGVSVSRDQVLRIRQVIKDCPYRQQGVTP